MVHFIWPEMTDKLFSLPLSKVDIHCSCQNVYDALFYLLDNICIRFGTKLYRQIVGIPMGTNCVPLVANLFLYCYERDFAAYGVYISQRIRFARVCNHVADFNARNKCLTAKLLQQVYRYHKLQKTFSKFIADTMH